jgi:hypothetical protein
MDREEREMNGLMCLGIILWLLTLTQRSWAWYSFQACMRLKLSLHRHA